MNEYEKLRAAMSIVEAAQRLLAEAGREIFNTIHLEEDRAAIWQEHEQVKALWERLEDRSIEIRHVAREAVSA